MCIVSFKERVKKAAIANAGLYELNYVNVEYLVCSEAFRDRFRIIKSDKGNYLHLIGVHTDLTAEGFFNKCKDGILEETDFDFVKPKSNEKSVKGSVREKIVVLPEIMTLFEKKIFAEEHFKKNKVECTFATSDNKCTLGFAVSGRPKSLLKGNELDKYKKKEVDLVFRKPRGCKEAYSELIFGNMSDIEKYKDVISGLISEELVAF